MPLYYQTLSATSPIIDSFFGFRTAIQTDASSFIVGAPASNSGYGLAYCFTRAGGYFNQASILNPGTTYGSPPYYFGAAVQIDNNSALVGAPGINSGQGRVFSYQEVSAGTYTIAQAISPPGAGVQSFGISLALSANNTLFVGSTGINSGRGGVIQFNSPTGFSGWTFTNYITSNNFSVNSLLGYSIAINPDIPDELYVGAPSDTQGRGRVAYFKRSPTLGWVELANIRLNGSYGDAPGSQFGWSVAVKRDILVIGSRQALVTDPFGNSAQRGAAFVYSRSPGAPFWTLSNVLSTNEGDAIGTNFGYSVAISGTGLQAGPNRIFVGAADFNTNNGRIFVYNADNIFNPYLSFTLENPRNLNSQTGHSISLSDGYGSGIALLGAPGNIETDLGSGDRFGGVIAAVDIGDVTPTPTPTVTQPLPSSTPTPTPGTTPRFLESALYGLGPDLDPISIGTFSDGAGGTTVANYPKAPSKGGPGRNFSIIRELGTKWPSYPVINAIPASISQLSSLYATWCYTRGLNASNPTAFSEFCNARGISLAFNVTTSQTPETPTKYSTANDGTASITVTDNPLRPSTYDITFDGVLFPNSNTASKSGLAGPTSIPWSVVDNFTGYTRSGSISVGYGGSSTTSTLNYKTNVSPLNPP